MKSVSVYDAVGLTLCHDITEIIPSLHKGPAFRKGHIVTEEDIPHLLRLGKEHLYIWEEVDSMVHEDEAALRIARAIAGPGVIYDTPLEGRVTFSALHNGLLHIDSGLLERANSIPHVTIATLHSLQGVLSGRRIAGARVIPLTVPEATLVALEECCCGEYIFFVKPYHEHRVSIITTGSEVYTGKIKDAFGPALRKKFEGLSTSVQSQVFVPDETEQTAAAIRQALDEGSSMVLVTGGMSVDPDDKTPAAIREVASDIISYGAPVFPGAMFMMAYKNTVPIVGLPGCVMYHQASIFDVLLPRLLAGVRITKRDIVQLAHGGFCEGCQQCHYPACGFGKVGG